RPRQLDLQGDDDSDLVLGRRSPGRQLLIRRRRRWKGRRSEEVAHSLLKTVTCNSSLPFPPPPFGQSSSQRDAASRIGATPIACRVSAIRRAGHSTTSSNGASFGNGQSQNETSH